MCIKQTKDWDAQCRLCTGSMHVWYLHPMHVERDLQPMPTDSSQPVCLLLFVTCWRAEMLRAHLIPSSWYCHVQALHLRRSRQQRGGATVDQTSTLVVVAGSAAASVLTVERLQTTVWATSACRAGASVGQVSRVDASRCPYSCAQLCEQPNT